MILSLLIFAVVEIVIGTLKVILSQQFLIKQSKNKLRYLIHKPVHWTLPIKLIKINGKII